MTEPTSPPEAPGVDLEIAEASEVAPFQRPPVLPGADEFDFVFRMAEALSRSQLVPSSARGKPADVAIVLLAARDMGIPLTMALAKLHVIDGRLTLSAEVMVALCIREGHRIWGEDCNATSATACLQRRGSEYVTRFTFTIDDASTAGLLGKDNWKKYPKAMLWARAATGVIRMGAPEVTAGITYTPDEIEGDDRYANHAPARLEPSKIAEIEGAIGALDAEQKDRLRAEWKTWALNAPSRLTREEEQTARDLIAKAAAIDVTAEAVGPAERTDTPPDPPEAPTEPQGTAGDAYGLPPLDGERPHRTCVCGHTLESHGGVEGWTCRGDGIAPCSCTEWCERPEPGPDDCPDCGHPQSDHGGKGCAGCFCERTWFAAAPTSPVDLDATAGHCSACGGPIWRDDVGLWNHADDEDREFCRASEPDPAGPGVDVDALYAAARAAQPPDGTPAPELSVEAQIEALTPTEVMLELTTAGLSVAGTQKVRRERLLTHRRMTSGVAPVGDGR